MSGARPSFVIAHNPVAAGDASSQPVEFLPEEVRHGPLPAHAEGDGPAIVLLHGYGVGPRPYLPLAHLLSARARVLIPHLFAVPGRWTYRRAVACLEATLDHHGAERASLIAHSFGGAFALGLAARSPERVVEAVFADTLGVSHRWGLARDAVRPSSIPRLATPSAAIAFFGTVTAHPIQLARAGWWGFDGDRREEIAVLARAGIPCHIVWAARDTLLSREDGRRFARALDASFSVAGGNDHRRPLDHDWMYRHPGIFFRHLRTLGLKALAEWSVTTE